MELLRRQCYSDLYQLCQLGHRNEYTMQEMQAQAALWRRGRHRRNPKELRQCRCEVLPTCCHPSVTAPKSHVVRGHDASELVHHSHRTRRENHQPWVAVPGLVPSDSGCHAHRSETESAAACRCGMHTPARPMWSVVEVMGVAVLQ